MALIVTYTISGQENESVSIDQSPFMVGSLLSNQLVLAAPGVEPIHALLEELGPDQWMVTDLGSSGGIRLNGGMIDVEASVRAGDILELGSVTLCLAQPGVAPPPPSFSPAAGEQISLAAVKENRVEPAFPEQAAKASREQPMQAESLPVRDTVSLHNSQGQVGEALAIRQGHTALFSPQQAKPGGDVLEVVAYWGSTILEVEHFHPSEKGFERVTIGDPTKAHFFSVGEGDISCHEFATFEGDGYRLNLLPGMHARLRRGGSVEEVGEGAHNLGSRDLSQVRYGPVRFFLLFMKPPAVTLPPKRFDDPFFLGLMSVFMVFFLGLTGTLLSHDPVDSEELKSDIWSMVQVPEKSHKLNKIRVPEVSLAELKKPPPPRKEPPKPALRPVEPASAKEREKPARKKEVKKKVRANMMDHLKKVSPAKSQGSPPPRKPQKPSGSSQPPVGRALAKGLRKSQGQSDYQGVAGAPNKKPSGVNLGRLGLGVGKIKSIKGPGAVFTKFRNSAGGAGSGSGSGSGSAPKNFRLGGVASSVKTLGLAGSGKAINQFGSGSGGFLGNSKRSGLGSAFNGRKGQAAVNVSAGDPLISGSLTRGETRSVIQAGLNQIRHCYERLLQRSPNASGRVKVRFVIGVNGRVTSAKVVSSTISDGRMRKCILGVVRRWKFPKPRGGGSVDVNYPFVFNPV